MSPVALSYVDQSPTQPRYVHKKPHGAGAYWRLGGSSDPMRPVRRAHRKVKHCFGWECARPTGGRHGRTGERLAQRFKDAQRKAALQEDGGRARPIVRPGAKTTGGADPSPALASIRHYFTSLLRSAHLPSAPIHTMFSRTCCMSSYKSLTRGPPTPSL